MQTTNSFFSLSQHLSQSCYSQLEERDVHNPMNEDNHQIETASCRLGTYPYDQNSCVPHYELAGRLGIEPRFAESKAAVLPLDDLPMNWLPVFDSNELGQNRLTVAPCYTETGWPVGNRTLVKRLSSAYSTIELQAIRIWWAGAVTIHSLKDEFYRPTARTTSFTCPKLAVPHAVGTNVLDIHCDLS